MAGVILVAGEALIDLVPASETIDSLAAHPGGGPFNAARTIARLERPVAYLGRLSRDRFGQRLEALLAKDGVRLDAIVHTNEPTTLALADVDELGVARYRFYTEGTRRCRPDVGGALAAAPTRCRSCAGTLGLVLEPTASALEAVIVRLSGHAMVFVDPNVRPDIPRRGCVPGALARVSRAMCSRSARRTSTGSRPDAAPWTPCESCWPAGRWWGC